MAAPRGAPRVLTAVSASADRSVGDREPPAEPSLAARRSAPATRGSTGLRRCRPEWRRSRRGCPGRWGRPRGPAPPPLLHVFADRKGGGSTFRDGLWEP